MDRQIVWTDTGWNDLEDVVRYIAKDSARYAAAFAREVRSASRSLSHFSERGRMVPELGRPDIREIFVRSYRLVYLVSAASVYVLGLIHGARNLSALWD